MYVKHHRKRPHQHHVTNLPPTVPCVNRLLGGLHSARAMEYGFWSQNRHGVPVGVPPFALRFSTQALNGHALAAADEEGVVTVLDTRRSLLDQMHSATRGSAPLARFVAHDNAIFDIIWMQDDTQVATASGDGTIRVFDVESTYRRALLRGHSGSAKCIRALPSMPNVLMSAARDGNVRAYDLRTPSVTDRVNREEYHTPVFTIHQPHTPASGLATAIGAGSRKRRRVRADKPRASQFASVTSLAFYPGRDSMLYTAGAADGCVKLWDLRSLRGGRSSTPSDKRDGNVISAVCVASATPAMERRRDAQPRSRRTHGIAHVDIDDQGRHLLVSSTDSTIYLYNASNLSLGHSRVFTGHTQTSFYIRAAFSPDGRHILSGSADANAYIWDVRAPTVAGAVHPILSLHGHQGGEASAVDWCRRDPLKLATCADDSSCKVWYVDATRRPAPPPSESDAGDGDSRLDPAIARVVRPKVRDLYQQDATNCNSPNRYKNADIRDYFRPRPAAA